MRLMTLTVLMTLFAGCATPPVPCDGKLTAINPPLGSRVDHE